MGCEESQVVKLSENDLDAPLHKNNKLKKKKNQL